MPDALAIGVGPAGLAYALLVFLLAGVVKGVIAFGLPLVTVPLLSLMVPVPTAIAWSLGPVLVSNLAQAHECRRSASILREAWPLLLAVGVTVPVAAGLGGRLAPGALYVVTGAMIEVTVLVQLLGFRRLGLRLDGPPRRRVPLLVASGGISGVVGGLTSFYGFPAIQTLLALGPTAEQFAFVTSVLFLVGAAGLSASLAGTGSLGAPELAMSAMAVVPLMAGLRLGRLVRHRLRPEVFSRLILAALAATGLSLLVRGLG